MLALTKKMDYALIALAHLAGRAGEVVCAREVSEATRIPQPILTNILKTLVGGGIVVSERGASGGYGLAHGLEDTTLHELISVVEGPFQFVQCMPAPLETGRTPCDLESSCPIRGPVHQIHGRLRDFLEGVSLADIVKESSLGEGSSGESGPVSLHPSTISECSQ